MADAPKGSIERYLFQGFATVIGLSLSLNSFFVTDKIQEISQNIARMAASIQALELSSALVKQQMEFQAKEIETLKRNVSELNTEIYRLKKSGRHH